MYMSADYSSNSGALFSRRKKGSHQWERIAGLAFSAVAFILFVIVIYQGNRISSLKREIEQFNRDSVRLMHESSTLRASLNSFQQERDTLEVRLKENGENLDLLENALTRQRLMTDSAESEGRKTRQSLLDCERNAKKREEELEADLATVNQEKRDLSIRVDTEHSMAADWSKKLANEKLAREDCEEKVKSLEAKFIETSNGQNQTMTSTTHEDETAKQMGRKAAGGAGEGEKHDEASSAQ
eukprot:g3851.t1